MTTGRMNDCLTWDRVVVCRAIYRSELPRLFVDGQRRPRRWICCNIIVFFSARCPTEEHVNAN